MGAGPAWALFLFCVVVCSSLQGGLTSHCVCVSEVNLCVGRSSCWLVFRPCGHNVLCQTNLCFGDSDFSASHRKDLHVCCLCS